MSLLKTHIVALSGYAGAGKDTVADILATHLRFRKLAFADALRAEVSNGFDVALQLLTDPARKNVATDLLSLRRGWGDFQDAVLLSFLRRDPNSVPDIDAWLAQPRSPRQILQWWGTEFRRQQREGYWSERLMSRIAYYEGELGERRFVITDCRFANEAEAVGAAGGVIWQIRRPGLDATTTPEGTHASVADGSAFGPVAVIDNDQDVPHLQRLVLSRFFADEAELDPSQVSVTVRA